MNTTDQAFIRAYGSDFVPSNADEAARAADYSALADSNVNAVFGSMPRKHTRVDGPVTMPHSVAPQVANGGPPPPSPLPARPYVPQPETPPTATAGQAPSPAAPGQQAPPLDSHVQQPIGQQREHLVPSEPAVGQGQPGFTPSEPIVEQPVDDQPHPHTLQDAALPPGPARLASHGLVPRPHINFAAVQSAQDQSTGVVANDTPVLEEPHSPMTANNTLRSADGISVLADNSVLIGSSDFQWPTVHLAVDELPMIAEPEPLEAYMDALVEPTSQVEVSNEVETNDTPPIVPPEVESEEPPTRENPLLNSLIANIDKDAVGLEVDAKDDAPVVAKQKLKPAWEVDRLLWPSDVDQLYESESEYFRHAGEKLYNASQEGLRVLGISATHAGEGCTTLAICLARAAAEAGAKVGLVDANLRSPSLGTALGLDFARSWHETLNGRIPLAEAAVTAIADNVTLMPLSKNGSRQGLELDAELVNDVLSQAAETFDLVLVDIGVLSENGSSCFLGGSACPLDAAIIVRDVRTTSEEETLESVNRFKEMGVDAVGIAENFAPSADVQAAA